MHVPVKQDIDWVGIVDWNIRDFHGYNTPRGSTYNAYLVRDQKTALIDTVKAAFADNLLANVAEQTDLAKVDYIVCNHAEPDHAGGLPAAVRACPNAQVVCDARCREALGLHFDTDGWKIKVVADGEVLPLGRRGLKFIETPMVHWPESMFTYVPEERLLFSMDGFGQHLAASGRFDDQVPLDVIMAEAKSYYANILMPFGVPIARTLEKVAPLAIETIAPSHGVIWRKNPGAILAAYRDWVALKRSAKVLVVYDTMWKSTEKMGEVIAEGAARDGVEVKVMYLRATTEAAVATEALDAACLAFGCSTLNGGLMPRAAGILAYLRGLKPVGKAGFAFGSYGWAPGATREIDEGLRAMKFQIVREPLVCRFAPKPETLQQCRQAGAMLADKARQLASG